MSDSALSFQPCKQIAARRLSEDILPLHSYRGAEKGGEREKVDGASSGKNKKKENKHPMF